MVNLIATIGIWCWVVLGLVLLILEVLIPGTYMIWFGLAAIVTALLAFIANGHFGMEYWQAQTMVFLILSLVIVITVRKFSARHNKSDVPFLNQRIDQMIGTQTILYDDLINGHGHVKIDDTIWRVTGPDLPKGSHVRLVAYQNGAFRVEQI